MDTVLEIDDPVTAGLDTEAELIVGERVMATTGIDPTSHQRHMDNSLQSVHNI